MATAPLPVSQVAGGGDVGQVLTRTADEAGRGWSTLSIPEGLPPGGTAGQVLSRTADGYAWVTPASGGGGGGSTMSWNLITTCQPTYKKYTAGTLDTVVPASSLSDHMTRISLASGNHLTDYAKVYFGLQVDKGRHQQARKWETFGSGITTLPDRYNGQNYDGRGMIVEPVLLMNDASPVTAFTDRPAADGSYLGRDLYRYTQRRATRSPYEVRRFYINPFQTNDNVRAGSYGIATVPAFQSELTNNSLSSGDDHYTFFYYFLVAAGLRYSLYGTDTFFPALYLQGGLSLRVDRDTSTSADEGGIFTYPLLIESESSIAVLRSWTSSASITDGSNLPFRVKVWGLR